MMIKTGTRSQLIFSKPPYIWAVLLPACREFSPKYSTEETIEKGMDRKIPKEKQNKR